MLSSTNEALLDRLADMAAHLEDLRTLAEFSATRSANQLLCEGYVNAAAEALDALEAELKRARRVAAGFGQ